MIDRRTLLALVGSSMPALLAGRTQAAGTSEPTAVAGMETAEMTEGFVDVLGGQLKYLSAGTGEALILLHKLGGRLQEWRRLVPPLAAHYRVIAFDLAGHGKSEMHGAPPFIVTQESVAAQVMGALDSLDIPPPYRFVGSSLGGCVAVVCAALWPERVAAVVSVGSALGGASSPQEIRDAAAKSIADGLFDSQHNPLPRDMSYARSVFGLEDAAIAREQNESRAEAGRWIAPASRGVGRFDYLARLPRVTAPVLLAWGERGAYGRFVDAALALLPQGRKAMVPDSGAFPHEEAPDATAELVLSFLQDAAQ